MVCVGVGGLTLKGSLLEEVPFPQGDLSMSFRFTLNYFFVSGAYYII